MTVYVHVRDLPALREHVAAAGPRAETARRAGMTPQRLHQLVHGDRTTVAVTTAAALEDALSVDRGTLFRFPDTALAAPYASPDAVA
jgi:transcriptional regulator with XRE-family HTH domain